MFHRRIFLVFLAIYCGSAGLAWTQSDSADESASRHVIELTIDYGDGFQKRYTQIGFDAKMTVLDALVAASKHPRGIRFQHRGQENTAFLTSLDNVANQGADGRNWLFHINGKLARKSCGIATLEPGDRVLWQFGWYEDQPREEGP